MWLAPRMRISRTVLYTHIRPIQGFDSNLAGIFYHGLLITLHIRSMTHGAITKEGILRSWRLSCSALSVYPKNGLFVTVPGTRASGGGNMDPKQGWLILQLINTVGGLE